MVISDAQANSSKIVVNSGAIVVHSVEIVVMYSYDSAIVLPRSYHQLIPLFAIIFFPLFNTI